MKGIITAGLVCSVILSASYSQAALAYDQNVTPDVIFGDGNANGAFTVGTGIADTSATVEIGLRAKLRFDENGQPQNIFNSNGDGTYTFEAGVAPGQTSDTPVWNFEWSVNTASDLPANINGATTLNGLTYVMGIDLDPGAGTQFVLFDPVNQELADHAIGDNGTGNGGGVVAADAAEYAVLLNENNVAQNSWRLNWFGAFDPTATGTYDIYLSASDSGGEVTRSDIQVVVIPEPASIGLLALISGGIYFTRRFFLI